MSRKRFRDSELRKQLGQRIRALRKKRGVGTQELALRAGFVDRTSLLRVERADVGGISLERLVRLADELGVTTDYLLGRTEQGDAGADGAEAARRRQYIEDTMKAAGIPHVRSRGDHV